MGALRPDLKFDGGPNAVQRLGLVVWWFTLALTVLIAALAVWIGWLMPRAEPGLGIVLFILALGAWTLGRALLFVLAGR
jgi:hypothetical protein